MTRVLYDAIAALLLNEPTLLTELAALGLGSNGQAIAPTKVLKSLRPFKSLGQEHFPCWIIEAGDDQSVEEAVGGCHQGFETEVLLALMWHQQDNDIAFNQRVDVPGALTRLFLRNPMPGGIASVHVDAVGKDRSANHPTHVVMFRLLADVSVQK